MLTLAQLQFDSIQMIKDGEVSRIVKGNESLM